MELKIKARLLLMLFPLFAEACSYSFTGAAIDPDLKTVSVQRFDNIATIVVPTFAQELTEALRDKLLSQTNLKLKPNEGDLNFTGEITNYVVTPLTVQGNDIAAQNRLTVTTKVKFENKKHPEKSWENTFEQFADFPSSTNFNQIEADLRRQIQEKLIQDIFNKALANW